MKKKKLSGFTCFIILLLIAVVFFLIQLVNGMQKEKKTYTALLSLGSFSYDEDFLNQAAKIKGIKEIWPVVEIPVTIKIEDYTEETSFLGIDFNAFGENPEQESLGNTPILLLGENALQNMKDSNGHEISQKQQKKYLKLSQSLKISYSITQAGSQKANASLNPTSSSSSISQDEIQNEFFPCTAGAVLSNEKEQIYIPLSQAQSLCQKAGIQLKVTKIFLKINGKKNLEQARQLFQQ